jgi:hypothetical protein
VTHLLGVRLCVMSYDGFSISQKVYKIDSFPQSSMIKGMNHISSHKDVSVMQTDRYIIVKIPKSAPEKDTGGKGESFADLQGVLKSVPAFQGKSSVEVQHMISSVWTTPRDNPAHS